MDRTSANPISGVFEEVNAGGFVRATVGSVAGSPPIVRSREARAKAASNLRFRDLSIRGVNVLAASFLILVFLPLMAVITVLIKLTSRGPVIYAQNRVGMNSRRQPRRRERGEFDIDRRRRDLGGKIFRIYKFRTMSSTEGRAPQVWASKDDPRVTSVGRFLRAHRLDELPQLFNVLKGDMNLVGPRPEQPEIFMELSRTIPVYPERQRVRPGITGWAQINHSYDQSIEDVRRKLYYDLEYVKRRSVVEDMLIMAKTPSVMILRKGAR